MMMAQANSLKPRSLLRKRLPRYKFESSDRTLLQNLVNKYIGILERKAINQNMLDEKKRAWQLITQKFNSQSVDKRVRDAKQLRKCWENMKWRARREVKQADIDVDEEMEGNNGQNHRGLSDFTHPSHLTSGMMGVGEFMGGSLEDEDEGEDGEENEDGFYDEEEEEEMVAPMGTEPIEISDDLDVDNSAETNGGIPMMALNRAPLGDPRHPNGLPISHPPSDELIGSFVADAWIAEEAPGEEGDREAIHLRTEIGDSNQDNQIWNGATSLSPIGSLGGTSSSNRHTHTPPLATSDVSQDRIPRAPSVSSDAAESLSSRHSISSSSRSAKRPRDRVYINQTNAQPRRPSSSASPVVVVDGDATESSSAAIAVARRSSIDDAERQMRSDEEHTKKMELLQAQLDFEKSKVERMRRMMEMSEIEHRARMRMLVRYQQVAEKQKEYWSHHVDGVKHDQVNDQF